MKNNRFILSFMAFMSKFMLSCESAGVLMCIQQQEKLSLNQRMALKMHLLSCKLCRRFQEDLEHVQSGIDHLKDEQPDEYIHSHLDDQQKRDISQRLENQAKNS